MSLCKNFLHQDDISINNSIESETLDQLEYYLLLNEKLIKDFLNIFLLKKELMNINNKNLD